MGSKNNPTLKSSRIRIGITIGDPSGIGPSITKKAVKQLKGLAEFVVIGDSFLLKGIQNCTLIDLHNLRRKSFEFGKVKAEYGRASIGYLDKAIEMLTKGEIDSLVTSPISKEAISLAGFHFPGHTEYLASRTGIKDFAMMLLNNKLRFSLVSRHIPLMRVPQALSQRAIYKNILLTIRGLRQFFLIQKPRIAVCGLNPHASDNGIIGREELTIIRPAIKKINRQMGQIAKVAGPLPSDVAIYEASKNEFDCVIAMYHDQALIPLKLSGFESGVNLTLGLNFVRTSPLHGTAFDIARGSRNINPHPLIEAIKLAVKCTLNLKRH